uniref:Dolichyl-diphosphooligosaccharide--protein glycosyltransferase subunit DAD1 n=1 Tax=Vombatus ursinus TaxID=29139 RepID=A0A4X2M0H2_VOMUR
MRGHGTARMVVGSGRGAGGVGRGQDGGAMPASVASVISRFLEEYMSTTPQRLKLLDAYLLYILLTGALQFGYCLLVGTFPFNSFLSGFISCVGSFILADFHFMGSRIEMTSLEDKQIFILHTYNLLQTSFYFEVRGGKYREDSVPFFL